MRIPFIKKTLVVLTVASSIAFVSTGSFAEDMSSTNAILTQIHNDTTAILERVNGLPNYLIEMLKFIGNVTKDDDSQSTADMFTQFDIIGKKIQQDYVTQNGSQLQVMADLIGQPISGFALPADNPSSILKEYPNVNDLAYTTMIGLPPATKGEANPYNYLKNASGISLFHEKPGKNWAGPINMQKRYMNYYNTVVAIESFNAYILSQQYADYQNGNSLTNTQLDLITKASNANWITAIVSEEIGKVLRQLLMFQSQTYVLLAQMVQTQKQMVMAQAMTNAAIIASNTVTENGLVKVAQ